jgi:L-ascorbate metabolism protein UlaG (beta-lactamase superfamily)
MKLKWLAHSSFLITSDAGVRIITDPYESGGFSGGLGYRPIRETADIVTVSHEHSDHNHVQDISGSPAIIRKIGRHEVKGIELNGVLTCHDRTSGRERGLNTVFCFTVDGVRVGHLGDLGHELSAAEIAAIGAVDVVLIPVGGHFTIDAAQAACVVAALKPKIAVPMHFKTPELDFPIAGVDDFASRMSAVPVKRAGKSEIALTPATLPASTEVWILEHAL